MPNAKVLVGSNRLKQTMRALKDQWLITEATWSDAVRRKFEDRYLVPSIRPSTPRSTACKRWPRFSTRSAAIVPTGVRHREHVDLAAQPRRDGTGSRLRAARSARRSRGAGAARSSARGPARALAPGGRSGCGRGRCQPVAGRERRQGRHRVRQDTTGSGRKVRHSTARPGPTTSSGGA